MSITSLNLYQVGKETVWGTAVPQTSRLMGVRGGDITPGVISKIFMHRGSLAPGYETELVAVNAAGFIEQTGFYEDILYPLEGLFGVATPSGAGPYTYSYTAPLTSEITPRIFTYAKGQSPDIYSLLGGLVEGVNIKAEAGESDTEVVVRWDLRGMQGAEDTLDALSDRTVNAIMAHHFAVYMDAWGGTIGATQLNATVKAFELALKRTRVMKRYLGSIYAGNYESLEFMPADNTLKLSLEFNTTVNAIVDSLLGATAPEQRQIRLKATNGTNQFQFDFTGTIMETPVLFTDNGGINFADLTLQGTYNPTLGNWFAAEIINDLSALP